MVLRILLFVLRQQRLLRHLSYQGRKVLACTSQTYRAEKRIKEIQFCDNCVHFCPIEEGEENKPNEELCEFKRPLRFRLGIDDYTGDDTGFFCPGCKNFKKKEI